MLMTVVGRAQLPTMSIMANKTSFISPGTYESEPNEDVRA